MSIAELKATAEKLTAKERAWLRAYLFAQERATDPAWKAEMARRRRRIEAGEGITDTEVKRRLRSVGRRVRAGSK